jgi:predicted alpha/beta-fold hydrolase
MAADDPIIPVEDFSSIRLNKNTAFIVQRFGGHCGYIDGLSMRPWYQGMMLKLFEKLKGA